MSKFETPQAVSCEDGERHLIVKGHDRPAEERYELMHKEGSYYKSEHTWARIVPSGGRPGYPYYVAHGNQYKDQRGAFPATIYYTPPRADVDVANLNQSLSRAQIELTRPCDSLNEHRILLKIARLRRELNDAINIMELHGEMMRRFEDGEMVDLVSDYLAKAALAPS